MKAKEATRRLIADLQPETFKKQIENFLSKDWIIRWI